jgi:hypothetical protein
MTDRQTALLAIAVACGLGVGIARFAHRRDAGLTRTDPAIAELRLELEALRGRTSTVVGELVADVALCRQRTESLRGVLEVLIPSGVWPERVALPDPPPGWKPWPIGNKYGIDTGPRQENEP